MIGLAKDRFVQRKMARFLDRHQQHVEEVKQDQSYGVTLGDGSLANLENRWVRQALLSQGRLYRRDRQKHSPTATLECKQPQS